TAQAAAAQAATANATTGTPVPPQPGQTTPDGQPAGEAKLAHALAGAGDDASPKAGASHLKPDAALPQAQAQADANTMLPQTPVAVPQHLQPAATTGVNAAAASQLTATNAANAPVPVEGLAVEIATRAKGGATRFDIRLDPAELGRIDVRIDVDRHGQVTSHLTVEKPETLQMLRQDQTQLQRALDDAGLKTGDSGLQFSLRDQSSSGQQGQQQESGRRSQRLVISQDELPPTPVASRGYGRMLGASGGVDIRI
ncbi:flagellar hook-length control protein FliK, partial [Rhodopseudomonas sp. BR0C11]|uniref:flagellar hook-length control protein FliK n=1 Tax=Rhodopseudomonas sp. BR0C11 TaxID=2269370 RepID=UPI0013DEE3F6